MLHPFGSIESRAVDAWNIQQGAVNPRAIIHSLHKHMVEMCGNGADANHIATDDALRLIVHQLAFIMKLGDCMSFMDYGSAYHRVLEVYQEYERKNQESPNVRNT
jgi:hypothetical protein